ncbi:MAG: hypothetical protein ACK55Z_09620, partial [bacterium]
AAADTAAGIGGIPCRSFAGILPCECYGSWHGCASDTPDCVATPVIFIDSTTTKYFTTNVKVQTKEEAKWFRYRRPVPMMSTYSRCHLYHLSYKVPCVPTNFF